MHHACVNHRRTSVRYSTLIVAEYLPVAVSFDALAVLSFGSRLRHRDEVSSEIERNAYLRHGALRPTASILIFYKNRMQDTVSRYTLALILLPIRSTLCRHLWRLGMVTELPRYTDHYPTKCT